MVCLSRTRPTPEFLLVTIADGDSGLCKAELPDHSLGRSSTPPPAARAGYARPSLQVAFAPSAIDAPQHAACQVPPSWTASALAIREPDGGRWAVPVDPLGGVPVDREKIAIETTCVCVRASRERAVGGSSGSEHRPSCVCIAPSLDGGVDNRWCPSTGLCTVAAAPTAQGGRRVPRSTRLRG